MNFQPILVIGDWTAFIPLVCILGGLVWVVFGKDHDE